MGSRAKSSTLRGSSAESSAESYLSWLSGEEIRNVLRHLSARPLNPNWTAHISPFDAYNVMRGGGALAAPLRKELVQSGMRSKSGKGVAAPGPELICPTHTDSGKRIFEILATGIGPTLQRLAIDFPGSQFRSIDFLRQHCGHLRKLRVTAEVNLAPFLRQCEGKLRELEISGVKLSEGDVVAIAENCGGLQKLRIEYAKAEGELGHIWETVGPTLEELIIGIPDFLDDDGGINEQVEPPFDSIAKYCVKLDTFELAGLRKYRSSFMKMAFERGGHIRTMRFRDDCPEPNDLSSLLTAMPHARFDAKITWRPAGTMKIFGDRLFSLNMEGREFTDMEEASAALVNLEKVYVKIVGYRISNFVTRLFCSPSVHLRELWVDSSQYQHDTNLFDVIGERVKTIVKFRFSAHATFGGSYWKFAAANTSLRTVTVEAKMDGLPPNNIVLRYNAECEAIKTVKDFAQCPKLEELTVNNQFLSPWSKRIAEACGKIGRKGVDVFIGGSQYASSIQR